MCQSSVPNMILTVTLNAAIDKRYVVEGYQVGEVNRVKECAYTPGGKGLNVSKPASIAGAEVVATGFVGGHAGNYIEDALKPFGIKSEFYHLEEESRSCINIWDEVNHVQTEFLEPGFTVSEEEFKGFEKHFTELVKKADGVEIVAVSLGGDGSFVVCDDGIFRARVPKIDAVNTVGCGDSMIAGFALGLSEGLSVEETLKKASAISAAAALREETGFFVKEDMEKIYPQVEIEKIG